MPSPIEEHGLALLFANVLLEQLGLPIPAMPALVLAGALAADGRVSAPQAFAVSFLASAVGIAVWYAAGIRYGRRVLRMLCGISLSPDSCVRQTENQFGRWGALTLVLCKFIPGLATVAPPLAGAMRMRLAPFALFSGLGIALWLGVTIAGGMIFHRQVDALLAHAAGLGRSALAAALAVLAAYVALKWWERRRFYKTLRMARITVEELRDKIARDPRPLVVDLRALAGGGDDRRSIPGAIAMRLEDLQRKLDRLPPEREIVFLCDCPNEASAASAAKQLMALGYQRVRPLLGGLEAWRDAGYELEELRDR